MSLFVTFCHLVFVLSLVLAVHRGTYHLTYWRLLLLAATVNASLLAVLRAIVGSPYPLWYGAITAVLLWECLSRLYAARRVLAGSAQTA